MKASVVMFIRKCIREAISAIIHERQKWAVVSGRRTRINEPMVSFEVVPQSDHSASILFWRHSDFRNFLDSPEDIRRESDLEAS